MQQASSRQKKVQLEHQVFEITVSRSGGNESTSLSFLHKNSKSDIAANGQLGEMVEERLEKELLEGMESEGEEQNYGSLPEDFDVKQQEILLGACQYQESSQNSKKYDDYAESERSSSQGSGFKEVKRKIIHRGRRKFNKRKAILQLQERQKCEVPQVKEEYIDQRENENLQALSNFESGSCKNIDKYKKFLEDQIMTAKNKLHFLKSKQQKNKLEARKYSKSGFSVRQISQKLNISRQTLKYWLKPTNKMNSLELVKDSSIRKEPILNKDEKKKSKVKRRSSFKRQNFSEEAKERLVKQYHRQKTIKRADFALQMRIPKSTFSKWVRDDQERRVRKCFLQNQQLSRILIDSFEKGSVLDYKDIRKCMSLTNLKVFEKEESWIDSYIKQYNLDSYFQIVKNVQLKEENPCSKMRVIDE